MCKNTFQSIIFLYESYQNVYLLEIPYRENLECFKNITDFSTVHGYWQ